MDWTIIKDFAIPAASILVPSAIAVWLAAGERKAARHDREEAEKRGLAQRESAAITEAFDAMNDLVEAGYQTDFRMSNSLRFQSARRIGRINDGLAATSPDVWDWIVAELGIVGTSLEERDDAGLAEHGELIVWRAAHFLNHLGAWRLGTKPTEWFTTAEHLPLSETSNPKK